MAENRRVRTEQIKSDDDDQPSLRVDTLAMIGDSGHGNLDLWGKISPSNKYASRSMTCLQVRTPLVETVKHERDSGDYSLIPVPLFQRTYKAPFILSGSVPLASASRSVGKVNLVDRT
jgi:hypothetical protein